MGMAERIKERRLALGYTQEELAIRLGLQKSAIAKYENGRVENIKRSIVSKMADVLECSPAYLLDFTNELNSDSVSGNEFNTLKVMFDEFGYLLNAYSVPGSYTLQHKKQKEFIIVISEFELKAMLYDISDYIGVLVSKKFESMMNAIRSTNELNAAHARTDISITDADIQHDDDIMDDDNF